MPDRAPVTEADRAEREQEHADAASEAYVREEIVLEAQHRVHPVKRLADALVAQARERLNPDPIWTLPVKRLWAERRGETTFVLLVLDIPDSVRAETRLSFTFHSKETLRTCLSVVGHTALAHLGLAAPAGESR